MRRGLDIYLDILATDGSLYRTVGRGDLRGGDRILLSAAVAKATRSGFVKLELSNTEAAQRRFKC